MTRVESLHWAQMLIGELSRLAGISTRMLRHYDSIGLVSPNSRSGNGYRDYTPSDIRRLFQVESLRTLGLSLQEIRVTLADADVIPTELVNGLISNTRERIAREQELIKRLESVRESGATSWRDVLDVIALMQGLDSADPSHRQHVALAGTGVVPAGEIVDALLVEQNLNVAGALQWALVRAVGDAMPDLVSALDSPDEQVRLRAITAIAKLEPETSTSVLVDALQHSDQLIRERAALAVGSRGVVEAVPELLAMVVRGSRDVDAAEMLGRLAQQHDISGYMADLITERLEVDRAVPGARSRLTQALADIPGPAADRALTDLAQDHDQAVSMTARYLLTVRLEAED